MEYSRTDEQTVEDYVHTWQLSQRLSGSISLHSFAQKLSFDFNSKIIANDRWYIPANGLNASRSDSFVLHRFLSYRVGDWKTGMAIFYYIVPVGYRFTGIHQLIKDEQYNKAANIRLYRSLLNDVVPVDDSASHQSGNYLTVKKSKKPQNRLDAPLDEGCEWVEVEWYWQTWVDGVLISEEYLFSTNEVICAPGAGGNSGGDTTVVPKNNPCDSVNKLVNNAEFNAKLDILKAKTSENREYAYYYNNATANEINETELIGPINQLSIEMCIPANFKLSGVMHNHFFKSDTSVSIFSIDDIAGLISLFRNGSIDNPYGFSYTLASPGGSQYMLKIGDLNKFSNFAQSFENRYFLESMFARYPILQDKTGQNNSAQNETNFLRIIQGAFSGLKLFKKPQNSTSWQPLKYISGQIINDPCQ